MMLCLCVRIRVYVNVHVDDFLSTGTPNLLADYRRRLYKASSMTGGLVERHYGLNISRGAHSEVFVNCKTYILDKCSELNIPEGSYSTPMASTLVLPKVDGPCLDGVLHKKYRSYVGSLMHCAVTCRPDVAFAVGSLSRHLNHPQEIHLKAAERVFKYLRATADLQLCYGHPQATAGHVFYGTSDASHCAIDFRGVSGWHFCFNGGSVSWATKFQKTISHSSTETELVALDSAARELVFLRKLLHDFRIKVPWPVTIAQDNTSTMIVANSGHFNARTKHIQLRYLYCSELIQNKVVALKYVRTTELSADVLTKALPVEDHRRHVAVLLGYDSVDLMAE